MNQRNIPASRVGIKDKYPTKPKTKTLKKAVKENLKKPKIKNSPFTNMSSPITRAQLGLK